ncbi:FkbM family methyltransferase [Leptolyngbya sp. 15MV]|nr:FkbM family methyltransferase [Leptolyngbya sp. 15MV]
MPARDLIFDVGLHRGEDTAFYLALGYRVVAFEANPALIAACRARFASELAQGRLTIVEGAVAADGASEAVRFFAAAKSEWGTMNEDLLREGLRAGVAVEEIAVPRIGMAACFERFGVPHYMKIDIEGNDHVAIEALRGVVDRPDYVSFEWPSTAERMAQTLRTLTELGYQSFAFVQQALLPDREAVVTAADGSRRPYRFEDGASGPFGGDLLQRWVTADAIQRLARIHMALNHAVGPGGWIEGIPGGWRLQRAINRRSGYPYPGWFDVHGRRASGGRQ